VGRNIRDIALPPGTGIGAIVRHGEVVIPHKSEVIQSEDHVILFMVDKKYIRDVETLFEVGVTYI
jgi:trk system potassium uptake protein TrkA